MCAYWHYNDMHLLYINQALNVHFMCIRTITFDIVTPLQYIFIDFNIINAYYGLIRTIEGGTNKEGIIAV